MTIYIKSRIRESTKPILGSINNSVYVDHGYWVRDVICREKA